MRRPSACDASAVISVPEAAAAGVLAGFAIAIPVGAIAVLILRIGLTRGFAPAAAAGLGVATVDFVYCTLAIVAGAQVASAIESWGALPLYISGAVLVAIGTYMLVQAFRAPRAASNAPPARPLAVYGRFVALTMLNPATVIYFAALATALAGQQASGGAHVAFVLGTGIASAAWQVGLAAAGALLHRMAGPRTMRGLSVLGAAIVVGLGVAIIVRGATG